MGLYLSNGTMGEMWLHEWCYRCERDHDFSHGKDLGGSEDGCPILLRLYTDEYPIPELQDNSGTGPWGPEQLVCRMFSLCTRCGRDDGGGDDGDPKSPPDPGPDHGVLFEVIDETPTTPMFIIPNEDLVPQEVLA